MDAPARVGRRLNLRLVRVLVVNIQQTLRVHRVLAP
jgi:hypothetical protein